jgi:hypothetical protein
MSPTQLLENPSLELFPVEVFRVQAKEAFGADLAAVSKVKAVFGLGQFGPQVGVVMRHDGLIDFDNVKQKLSNGETFDGETLGRRWLITNRLCFDADGPLFQFGCFVESSKDGAVGGFRNRDTSLIDALDQLNNRRDASPRHRGCPV